MNEEQRRFAIRESPRRVSRIGWLVNDWMVRRRQKVNGRMRTVWRAQAKIGTHPGTVALFLSEPVVGQACEVVDLADSANVKWAARVHRVTVERIDPHVQRVFCSLR